MTTATRPITLNNGLTFGAEQLHLLAGPCAVESQSQVEAIADYVKAVGATCLRGGAFKPRTHPSSFQGLGWEGLAMMVAAAKQQGLAVVSELMDVRKLEQFLEAGVDLIQIGSRNMQNFDLLRALGETRTPVMLKRGLAATIEEWLGAAEYLVAGGNEQIILCERGIRSFEPNYRNCLDLSAVAVLKQSCPFPVIIDPSHACGRADLVTSLSLAAIAAGADGLLIETHYDPATALSDQDQALTPKVLSELMTQAEMVAKAVGRSFDAR